MITFRDYILLREGLLLPDKPPRPGLPRINTTPFTNRSRTRTLRPAGRVRPGSGRGGEFTNRRRTKTLRPKMVKIARTPTVKSIPVARIGTVPRA